MVVFENPTRQIVITAVGPDNIGLADPIVHYVTAAGANICEIQMFNRDAESVFAMVLRADWSAEKGDIESIRSELNRIGDEKGLSIRAWPLIRTDRKPRLALCCTYRKETPRAVLEACKKGLNAEVAVMISNRAACQEMADQLSIENLKG